MKNLKIFIFIIFYALYAMRYTLFVFAQDDNKLVALSKQIIEAKADDEIYPILKELTRLYLEGHNYNEYVDYLSSLAKQKKALEPLINYHIGYTRYYQLKYLEEAQNWNEYFSQANTYRNQITATLQKAVDSTIDKDPLRLYSRLLLWQFHKDQQDTFCEQALLDLMNSVSEYAVAAKDAEPIKAAADKLLAYTEKGKAKELYKIYVDKLIGSEIKNEELIKIAAGFYREGNLDLSEFIYDFYMQRILSSPQEDVIKAREELVPILIDIAKQFGYEEAGQVDPVYVEKIFVKIEELMGKDIFDESLIYLRAFNLERAKEYQKAKDLYLDLIQRYPQAAHADEADYKLGIIYTYILRDVKAGRGYFEKLAHSTALSANAHSTALSANPEPVEGLAQKETPSPQVISSLYQLGLLSQWEEDLTKAKEYYNKLIEKAKDSFGETAALAKERLKEIEGAKPIEYNLKMFLDASLKEEYAAFDMTKLDLKSHPYKVKKDEIINISSAAHTAESGCLAVELQYLWSGHVGQTKPSLNDASFNTTYNHPGTKEINLVVVSPTGIIDRNIDLVNAE